MADGTSAAAETVAVANAYLTTPRYECTYGSTLLSGTECARRGTVRSEWHPANLTTIAGIFFKVLKILLLVVVVPTTMHTTTPDADPHY
jgi:hypothetical protein